MSYTLIALSTLHPGHYKPAKCQFLKMINIIKDIFSANMADCLKLSYFSYSYFINIPVCVSNRLLMGQRNSSFSVIRTGAEMILIPFHNAPLPRSNKVFPQESPFRYYQSLNPIVSLHLILHRIYSLLYQSSSFSFCFHPNNTTLSQTEERERQDLDQAW